MRPSTACNACRSKKRKCRREADESACTRCKARNQICFFGNHGHPGGRSNPEVSLSLSAAYQSESFPNLDLPASPLPDYILREELVNIYFDILHDKQHSILHRPSFMEELRRDDVPSMLLLAIMALAARFSTNSVFEGVPPWSRGTSFAAQAKAFFDARPVTLSLTALQTCILLALLSTVEGDTITESLYIALAIRMTTLLRIPDTLSTHVIQREVEIRVWWTVWMLDTWTSAGFSIPTQLTLSSDHLRPLDEVSFDSLESGHEGTAFCDILGRQNSEQHSLWAQMIPITEIVCRVTALHKEIASESQILLEHYAEVERINDKLDHWSRDLPPRLLNTPDNLEYFATRGYGRCFIALHLGYFHQRQLLYWPFLYDNYKGSDDIRETHIIYSENCRKYATELSQLLWLANTTPGSECLWTSVGYILTVASSVHLHSLLRSQSVDDACQSKRLLLQNFELMITMRRYWPGLDHSMFRLRSLNQRCQKGIETTFKMNKWILWFLHGHRTPIDSTHNGNITPPMTEETSDLAEFTEVDLWGGSDNGQRSGSLILDSFL